ncbi:hypothetical protein AB1Y20_019307 [Prymnesium parvum]|uniref:Uncharacterized protein n=1 Tax=Prymnesium parvum TaxID=97485 RepID=A0AB34JU12_PRYPA|mmetsp:Transcript_18210/g.38824  ORF Transcript_18210/g.38824 Transcript_18210/m.38824 type:complete len:321 (+) Transcript_18210:80-1042(+)
MPVRMAYNSKVQPARKPSSAFAEQRSLSPGERVIWGAFAHQDGHPSMARCDSNLSSPSSREWETSAGPEASYSFPLYERQPPGGRSSVVFGDEAPHGFQWETLPEAHRTAGSNPSRGAHGKALPLHCSPADAPTEGFKLPYRDPYHLRQLRHDNLWAPEWEMPGAKLSYRTSASAIGLKQEPDGRMPAGRRTQEAPRAFPDVIGLSEMEIELDQVSVQHADGVDEPSSGRLAVLSLNGGPLLMNAAHEAREAIRWAHHRGHMRDILDNGDTWSPRTTSSEIGSPSKNSRKSSSSWQTSPLHRAAAGIRSPSDEHGSSKDW